MKPTKCIECGGTLRAGVKDDEYAFETAMVIVRNVPVRSCPDCGEHYISGPDAMKSEQRAAAVLAHKNVTTGDALKFLRKSLALTAVSLAELLGTSSGTISKWETGNRGGNDAAISLLQRLVIELDEGRHDLRDQLEATKAARANKKKRRKSSGAIVTEFRAV